MTNAHRTTLKSLTAAAALAAIAWTAAPAHAASTSVQNVVTASSTNPNGTGVANGRTGGQPMPDEPLPAQPQPQPTPSQ